MCFVPPNKRTPEYFKAVFDEKGLQEIVKLHLAQVRLPLWFLDLVTMIMMTTSNLILCK